MLSTRALKYSGHAFSQYVTISWEWASAVEGEKSKWMQRKEHGGRISKLEMQGTVKDLYNHISMLSTKCLHHCHIKRWPFLEVNLANGRGFASSRQNARITHVLLNFNFNFNFYFLFFLYLSVCSYFFISYSIVNDFSSKHKQSLQSTSLGLIEDGFKKDELWGHSYQYVEEARRKL